MKKAMDDFPSGTSEAKARMGGGWQIVLFGSVWPEIKRTINRYER